VGLDCVGEDSGVTPLANNAYKNPYTGHQKLCMTVEIVFEHILEVLKQQAP